VDVVNPLGAASAIPGGGTGLVGLTERVRLAGGRLDHRATGTEFVLTASLPWPA
jgi:signal transduction histidine kinase